MEKMKLPIIRGIPKKEKWLSMDDLRRRQRILKRVEKDTGG